jgi:flagellar basal-body rod modification protein FlgD
MSTPPVSATSTAMKNASAAIAQSQAQNTGGASSGADSSNGQKKGSGLDYESFLKLLTAQLQNQDPLAPMDATQFMTQLAQLSTVEQSMKSNETLTQVLDTLKNAGMRMDMAYLGRTVEVVSDGLPLSGGTGSTAYAIEGTPASVRIEVLDSAGKTVYSGNGNSQTGRQVFTWDGKKTDGTTAPDGLYHVKITAKDASGAALNAATVMTDTVKEVQTVDGATQFVLKSGAVVSASDILSAS